METSQVAADGRVICVKHSQPGRPSEEILWVTPPFYLSFRQDFGM